MLDEPTTGAASYTGQYLARVLNGKKTKRKRA
jgi:hypothetical protein